MSSKTVNTMRTIGLYYLARHPRANLFHSNQYLAQQILDFNLKNASNEAIINFLREIYYQLPNYNGELSKAIRKFFYEEFQIVISQKYLMENISICTLKNIGIEYSKKYPKPTPWYCLFQHTNQGFAESLAKGLTVTNKPIEADAGYRRLWIALIDFYRWLPNANGKIAGAIDRLMRNVNNICIEKVEVMGNSTRSRSTSEIANKMSNEIFKRWHQPQTTIKLQR